MWPLWMFLERAGCFFRGWNRLQWPNVLWKCQSRTLKNKLGNTEDFKSKWINPSVLMDQVHDKLFIVGIMLCGGQTTTWNESYLIQHHSRMRKNFCGHIILQEGQWMGASGLHQSFVYKSQIHSESLASEIQECSITRILNFYEKYLILTLAKCWCYLVEGGAWGQEVMPRNSRTEEETALLPLPSTPQTWETTEIGMSCCQLYRLCPISLVIYFQILNCLGEFQRKRREEGKKKEYGSLLVLKSVSLILYQIKGAEVSLRRKTRKGEEKRARNRTK